MSENDSVAQHISKVENLAKQLKESGESNKPRKHLKESSDMLAFNVEISSYNTEENAWIMDSGASAHMTFRKDFFVELLKCSEKSLTLGNKQSVEVSGIGKVLIKRYVNGQWETSELHGVLTKWACRREIRTIVESARSMLYARDLPLDLWAEAVNCAVYILNRTSSSQTPGKTPYELWNGTKPELGHLKVFGSIGYVHVPDQLRTKLEKKSEKMLLIGYDNTNYRMYDMNKKTIKISRNVIFDEHQVPEVRKNITQICTIDDNEETTIQNNETEVRNMDETLIKTTVSESDDSLLSCNNDDPTYEPSQEIEDIMSHRNITLRPRNNRRFEANLVELSLPQTYDEALQSPQKYEWSQAIKEELSAHKENNTWNAVPRAGQRTLTTKWVFTIKKGENNEARYKARLCARGFTQIKDVDYQEIFSPTTRYDSIRIILSIAAKHKLEIQQFDVKTAFLNGHLQENIFIEVPEGVSVSLNKSHVLKLNKSLYGLKQASRCWNKRFTEF
ncbi:Retrovirus-related Pol polyprotein from transposon TNT 1-94 [Eumeta japonica]|uniref:Retrovirus-related Pol polyprotein from transposon TNT 1-94 n=1 Tax=Eumeta variegata TaxID=151549 RepID=A0A4C1YZA0_EUMVA|nr:Retrovirus-related Pol polyprotein from transposon TNT 1-94 [Eumeta japonica]